MLQIVNRSPRARRHDANLVRILEAAMDLVAADGLGALSMTKLAGAVDYTPGALYRYFGSKDALLSKLVERILEDLRALLDRAEGLSPTTPAPLTRVFLLVQGFRAFAKLEPHRFGLLAMTMAEPRVLLQQQDDREPVTRVVIAALQPVAEALGAATEADLLDEGDIAERTVCLFAMLLGLLQLQKQESRAPGLVDVDRLVVRGTRALLVGWGGKARTVDAAITRVSLLGDVGEKLGGAA